MSFRDPPQPGAQSVISVFPRVDEHPEVAGRYLPTTVARSEIIFLQGSEVHVASLDAGTVQGQPTMSFAFKMPDGKVAIVESTLRNMVSTVRAICAAHGREEWLTE